jgi:hypothetical protein
MKYTRTFRSSPAANLAGQLDTNRLGALQLPRDIGHDIDSISTANTTSDHAETTSVGGVRVGTDHQTARERVVFEDNLVDNARAGPPKANAVPGSSGGKEVVDLLVSLDGPLQILRATRLGLNQVVAVYGGGDGGCGHTSRHELKERHLRGRILAGNTL